jgi:hypothetical protein
MVIVLRVFAATANKALHAVASSVSAWTLHAAHQKTTATEAVQPPVNWQWVEEVDGYVGHVAWPLAPTYTPTSEHKVERM